MKNIISLLLFLLIIGLTGGCENEKLTLLQYVIFSMPCALILIIINFKERKNNG